jgi:hypothetical protein
MGTRNRNQDRSNLGEQTDNNERTDRSMNADSRVDRSAGSEGIENQPVETGRQQGREEDDRATSFSGQGAQKEGTMPEGEGTGYTGSSRGESGGRTRNSSRDSRKQRNQTGRQTEERTSEDTEHTESEDSRV